MSLPQFANPRLLLGLSSSRCFFYSTSSTRSFSSFPCSTSPPCARYPLQVAVPSCRSGCSGKLFPRRKLSGGGGTIIEERNGGKGIRKRAEMAGEERTVGFNKKRAEGKDGVQKKNLQLKVRKLNPVSTICYVQILGTGMDTQDTSPSVLLFFDQQRIIFNAGEGLQRFCTEHKIKLSKIDHIFLTRVCSETAGGLPGLLLTLAGIGEEGMSVNVWGPSELRYLVGAMKSFIPHAAMVHTNSFGETMDTGAAFLSTEPIVLIDDEVLKLSAILLGPCLSDETNLDEGKVNDFATFGSSQVGMHLKPGDVSVIYVCELPEIKGKFDPSKAAALGLKPGPKYRELQLGHSVMSDTQDIMVHPSDVLGPSIPGPVVLLVDCPTVFHLRQLLSLPTLNRYYTNSTDDLHCAKSVNCIIHLGPACVTNAADYKDWMRRFGATQHIMAGHDIKNTRIPILRSSARLTSRLSYFCPQLFPSPGLGTIEQLKNHIVKSESSIKDDLLSCESILAENLLKFHLRPYSLLGLDKSAVPSYVAPLEIVNELLSEIPEIMKAAKDVSLIWQGCRNVEDNAHLIHKNSDMIEEPWINEHPVLHTPDIANNQSHTIRRCEANHESDLPSCLEGVTREDMEIVLLGTGSSQPSKYRNVSSVYLNLFDKGSVLLDCGEGTLAQLKRRFGGEGADNAVKSLRFIWISHIHADHHVGIANILALRCKLLKSVPHDPLLVIGPRPLKRFLDAYSRLEELDMEFLDCRYTTEASWESVAGSPQVIAKCYHGDLDKNDTQIISTETASQKLENTVFGKYNQMQNYWKQPGSPVDIPAVLPLLTKLRGLLQVAGLEHLYSVPVIHCPQAYAVVLKASERSNIVGKIIPGWKLVYSGDTRPCQALIDASQDATVLIHEATFEDGMEDEAMAKNHSTAMEAIEVGTMARVYRMILTHFSQRYPKIPVFDESHMHNTCIGFDLMSVNLADLPMIPKVLPYLKLIFRNEMTYDESEDTPNLASHG